MSLFNINVTKKKIIAYQGCIGRSNEKTNSALEKRLGELVKMKELEIVPDSFSNEKGDIKFILLHIESKNYLSYESSPSSYGRNENLSILIPNSRKNYSRNLKKCEKWVYKKFKDLF